MVTNFKLKQTHPGERLWDSGTELVRVQERGSDPNDLIYLSVYQGDLLIEDLREAQRLIGDDITSIRAAQSELRSLLPVNYSAPWHHDNGRLVSNDSGRYYDSEASAVNNPQRHFYEVDNPPQFRR